MVIYRLLLIMLTIGTCTGIGSFSSGSLTSESPSGSSDAKSESTKTKINVMSMSPFRDFYSGAKSGSSKLNIRNFKSNSSHDDHPLALYVQSHSSTFKAKERRRFYSILRKIRRIESYLREQTINFANSDEEVMRNSELWTDLILKTMIMEEKIAAGDNVNEQILMMEKYLKIIVSNELLKKWEFI